MTGLCCPWLGITSVGCQLLSEPGGQAGWEQDDCGPYRVLSKKGTEGQDPVLWVLSLK